MLHNMFLKAADLKLLPIHKYD